MIELFMWIDTKALLSSAIATQEPVEDNSDW